MEAIEVIDTAVKVGLGALISGLTTYAVSARNHKSEKSKEAAKKRVDILTFSLEKLDTYFHCFSDCLSAIGGQHMLGFRSGEMSASFRSFFGTLDEKLILSRADRSIAASRLHLLGLTEANDIINNLMDIESDFRDVTFFESRIISLEELESISNRFRIEKNKTYDLLSSAFNDAYK